MGWRTESRAILASLLLVVLWGCQSPPPAPVDERSQPPTTKILHHWVSRGDSLYVIAWRYELDFQQLAAINGLQPPYTLYPGQKLSLAAPNASPQASAPPLAQGGVRVGKIETHSIEVGEPESAAAIVVEDIAPDVAVGAPGAEPVPEKITPPIQPPLPKGGWRWQWPAKGRVAREYDAGNVQKGVSIYTDPGVAVTAAAPGVVVYAGNGLRGYGNLIIVKHSERHLSAYAHNKILLAAENQTVAQGEKIAEVGQDTSQRSRLYFEIREDGKPIDPMKLLPAQ